MNVSPYHLTYCTNVHAGHDFDTMFANLRTYAPRVKQAIAPDVPFGLGLWISNAASLEMIANGVLTAPGRRCKEWMEEQGLYAFTLNGFPYGAFHGTVVKDQVYAPDWTTSSRVDYTKRLFDLLAQLLPGRPGEVSGGISTCPVSYRHWFLTESCRDTAFRDAAENFLDVVEHLIELHETTGHQLHLDIEPEPDGLLENSDEVVAFFTDYLLPIGVNRLREVRGLSPEAARSAILRHIQVCYDVCHFALAYEEPADTFRKFDRHGIRTGKIQVSSALKIHLGGNDEAIFRELEQFVEPTYLHQVTRLVDGEVRTYPDLPRALAAEPDAREWRAHFHVPIFLREFGRLQSTQDQILKVLDYLKDHPVTDHLEVETYTWDVLPTDYKEELTGSIVRELIWFRDQLLHTCVKPLSLTSSASPNG